MRNRMQPRLIVQFCEDIRHEIGGKVSIMGMLSDTVEVRSFPFVFPKICSHFILELPITSIPKNRFTIKMTFNGAEKQSVDIPISAFTQTKDHKKDDWIRIVGGIEMTNFEVITESKISVIAVIDDEEITSKFCTLNIKTKDESEHNSESEQELQA